MLSEQKQNFLLLRSSLQNLVQGRSVRLELTDLTKLVIALDEKLDSIIIENTRVETDLFKHRLLSNSA